MGNAFGLETYIAKQTFLPPPPTTIKNESSAIMLTTKSKNIIPVVHLRHPGSKYVIIFSHGNAEDLGGTESWLFELSRSLQVDVVGYDYSGYGHSTGANGASIAQPSESFCFEDIDAVYKYLVDVDQKEPNHIIAMGRSLGTGPTCELASKYPIGGAVLQSPLLSAIRVVMKTPITLPVDIFANIQKIQRIRCPVFIIHGEIDDIISVEHGKTLYRLIEGKTGWNPWWIENAGHNNIEHGFCEMYLQKLAEFISVLDNKNDSISQKKERTDSEAQQMSYL